MFLRFFSKSKPPPDDLELVLKYQQTGDLDCIGELFERHTEMVFLVCQKYLKDEEESKDATMQIFEQLVTALHKHEVTNFKSWLHVLAKNYCLMQLRSQKAKDKKEPPPDKMPTSVEMASSLHLADEEQHEQELQALEKGLTELPLEQRTCLEMFYLQQKSYKEIADLTYLPVNLVKSHIQNGRRNLKKYVGKHNEQS